MSIASSTLLNLAVAAAQIGTTKDASRAIRMALRAADSYARDSRKLRAGSTLRVSSYAEGETLIGLLRKLKTHAKTHTETSAIDLAWHSVRQAQIRILKAAAPATAGN